jgi:hypothetical protein
MYRVKVTSLDPRDPMVGSLTIRQHIGGDQWVYYSENGWFKTEAEAHTKAASYIHRNLRVEIIWQDSDTEEPPSVKLVRDIEPQHVYEAKRNQSATRLDKVKTTIMKLGSGFQALIIFLIALSPIAGPYGERWDLALMIGFGAVVVFLVGRQVVREEAKGKLGRV